MRSHVAIAGIKEQAAANDCAEYYHGHGVIVPPRAKRKDGACRKSERLSPYNETLERGRQKEQYRSSVSLWEKAANKTEGRRGAGAATAGRREDHPGCLHRSFI